MVVDKAKTIATLRAIIDHPAPAAILIIPTIVANVTAIKKDPIVNLLIDTVIN